MIAEHNPRLYDAHLTGADTYSLGLPQSAVGSTVVFMNFEDSTKSLLVSSSEAALTTTYDVQFSETDIDLFCSILVAPEY